jgi:hypothetical protein
MTEFKPQETTMDTFRQTETNLFKAFTEAGFDHKLSREIAHSFTQYMLGYVTEEGVARRLLDAGAEADLARSMATTFQQLRENDRLDHRHVPASRVPDESCLAR